VPFIESLLPLELRSSFAPAAKVRFPPFVTNIALQQSAATLTIRDIQNVHFTPDYLEFSIGFLDV
jgi:hypothetical protein